MNKVIHTTTTTFTLPQGGETKRLCLRQHRVLTLLKGEATLSEYYKGYSIVYPWKPKKSFFILKGAKHSIYPITDCKFQEVIYPES